MHGTGLGKCERKPRKCSVLPNKFLCVYTMTRFAHYDVTPFFPTKMCKNIYLKGNLMITISASTVVECD